jgi:hypothetical protein
MFCKVTKDEAIQLNVLSDQAFNAIGSGTAAALAMLSMAGKSTCMATSALVHASANHVMAALLGHRQAHGEFQDVQSLGALKKRPEVFLALVGDLNELLGAVLRGIDPKNDYMLNLFQMEKKAEPEKKG